MSDKPATQLAMELGIRRNMLIKWRKELRSGGLARIRLAAEALLYRLTDFSYYTDNCKDPL